uniref:Ig-like domain-containing protein n=1 Tax=Apteryx owenii TaxID=8824 RepID=A0A8B9PQZ9_APTOW
MLSLMSTPVRPNPPPKETLLLVLTGSRQAPYFIQKPTSIKVTLGEDAMFKCKVQGSPPLSVNWEKDGRHLRNRSDANRFQIESAGESNALTIQCTQLGDSGTYTCRAENPIGSASASALICCHVFGGRSSCQTIFSLLSNAEEAKFSRQPPSVSMMLLHWSLER